MGVKSDKRSSCLVKGAKGVLLLVVILALLYVVASIAWLVIYPDIPLPDDSALKITRLEIPDDENGFLLLLKAQEGLSDNDRKEILEINKPKEADPELVKTLKKKHGKRLEAICDSASKPYFQAPYSNNAVGLESGFQRQELQKQLDLLSLLTLFRASTWRAFHDNEKEELAQNVLCALRVGHLIQNSKADIYFTMNGTILKHSSLELINEMSCVQVFSGKEMNKWISILEKFGHISDGLKYTFMREYEQQKLISLALTDEKIAKKLYGEKPLPFYTRPLFFRKNRTKKLYVDYYTSQMENAGKYCKDMDFSLLESLHFSKRKVDIFKSPLKGDFIGRILLAVIAPSHKSLLEKKCSYEFEFQSLRIKLAVLAYISRNGKPPKTLKDLVPEYLPEVPNDPFDGKPIRYDREKAIVYSVGTDLKDDGGKGGKRLFSGENMSNIIKEKDITASIQCTDYR